MLYLCTFVLCIMIYRYVSGPGTKKSWYRVQLVTTSGRQFTLVIEVILSLSDSMVTFCQQTEAILTFKSFLKAVRGGSWGEDISYNSFDEKLWDELQ